MGIENQNDGRLFFSYLTLDPNTEQTLNKDFQAIATGKDPVNQRIILNALKEQKEQKDQLRLFNTRAELYNYIVSQRNFSNVIVSFLIKPDTLEEKNDSGHAYYVFKDIATPIAEHLHTCSPCKGFLFTLEAFCHLETLEDLSLNIKDFFDIDWDGGKLLKNITPRNTPFALTKTLEYLGVELAESQTSVDKPDQEDEEDKEEVKFTLESVVVQLKLVAQTLSHFKKELLDYVCQNSLKNAKQHLDYLKALEQIEDALVYSYINTPEYLQKNTSQPLSQEKELLGFIPLVFPKQLRDPVRANEATPIVTPKTPAPLNNKETTDYRFHGLIKEPIEVDLQQFPVSHNIPLTETDCLVLGDLHANTLKLIYFLIHESIMTGITAAEYKELDAIYSATLAAEISNASKKEFPELINKARTQLARFDELVAKLVPVNKNSTPSIILMGDIFSERGKNDRYTFKVLEQIKKQQVPTKILLSNHDMELLKFYENGGLDYLNHISWEAPVTMGMGEEFSRSLMNLCEYIRMGLVKKEEVVSFMEETYLPMLTGMHFNVCKENKEIHFFTHAPVDLSIVPELAKQFDISYDENTLFADPENLVSLGEKVNNRIKQLITNKESSAFYRQKEPQNHSSKRQKLDSIEASLTPLGQLACYRQNQSYLDRRSINVLPLEWSTNYLHGHDGHGRSSKVLNERTKTFDLDNILGHPDVKKGIYTTYYCGNNPSFFSERLHIGRNAPSVTDVTRFFSTTSSSNSSETHEEQKPGPIDKTQLGSSGTIRAAQESIGF